MYYLRSKAASQAVQFTVEKQGGKTVEPLINKHSLSVVEGNGTDVENSGLNGGSCSMEDGCVTCSA
jgi:ribonucleoside-diphosphate reductase alpha chain